MISEQHKFLFIHIPRCGGNSIQTSLAEHCDDIVEYHDSKGNIINEDGKQGLTVKNEKFGPRDIKHYTLQDYYDVLGDEIFDYFIFTSVRCPLERFISWNAYFNTNTISDCQFPPPIMKYVTINGDIKINKYIRYEYLQEDFESIRDGLNIKCDPLLVKNKTNNSVQPSKNLINAINQIYINDTILISNEKYWM
jgi:hypothetical protein